MAVSKNINKQSKVNARTKRPAPVKVTKISLVNSETTVEPVVPISAPQTEPIITEVVSYPEPETTVQVKRAPTMRSLVVGLIGGSIGGYMAYTGLKSVFLAKGYDQDKANEYSMYSAGVIGLVTFGILYKIIKN